MEIENASLVVYDEERQPLEPTENNAEAWQAVLNSRLGPRMKRALLRVASGTPWRTAAAEEGYANHADLYKNGKKYGIVNLETEILVNDARDINTLSNAELKRRLVEKPDDFTNRDLVNAAKGSVDVVLNHEKNKEGGGEGLVSAMESLAKTLANSDQNLEISVKLAPNSPEQQPAQDKTTSEVIDVGQE